MAGQPAKYPTAKSLESKVNEYFTWVQGEEQDVVEDGKVIGKDWKRYPEPITITGLALYLGFESRQSIYDYEDRGEFSYIIKNARLRVENAYERNLYSDKPTGSIFALKNMGWKDHRHTELTGEKGNPIVTETHVKIIRDKATGITPGDFTPQPATGTESEEKV